MLIGFFVGYNTSMMGTTITAIYEQGVLRPLAPLSLPEHAHVQIQIVDPALVIYNERERAYQVLREAGVIAALVPPTGNDMTSEEELERIARSLASGGPLSNTVDVDRDDA